MMTEEKKTEKIMEASEKYSLNFIKNATLSTLKKNSSTKNNNDLSENTKKKISYYNW